MRGRFFCCFIIILYLSTIQSSFGKNYIIPVEKDIDYIEGKKNTKTNKVDIKKTKKVEIKQEKTEIKKDKITTINTKQNDVVKNVEPINKSKNENDTKIKEEKKINNKTYDIVITKKPEIKDNNVKNIKKR